MWGKGKWKCSVRDTECGISENGNAVVKTFETARVKSKCDEKLNDYSESLCYIATENIIEKNRKRENQNGKKRES